MINFLINHLRLKYRIQIGYYAVGLVSLLIVAATYFSFEHVSGEFQRFALFSKQSQAALQLSKEISEIQRSAQIFTYQGHESASKQVHKSYQRIHDELVAYQPFEEDQVSSRTFLISKYLKSYYTTFQEMEKQRNLQSQLITVDLRQIASTVQGLINKHIATIKSGEDGLRLQLNQLLNQMLMIEKYSYLYFDLLDTRYVLYVKKMISDSELMLVEINTAHFSAEEKGPINVISEMLLHYETNFLEAVQRTRGYLYLVNVVMAADAYEMLYQAKIITRVINDEMENIEREMFSSIATVTKQVLIVSLTFLLLIGVISVVIVRSITQPVSSLTKVFNSLSHGSSKATIPVFKIDDEIAELANAASIFRDKNSETKVLLKRYQNLSQQLEEKVELRTEALEESNRELLHAIDQAKAATEAKGQFLANMSHEIRTPMNGIIGLSHLALEHEHNPRQRDYLSKIHASAESLLNILNDILDFSKIEAGHLDIESIPFNMTEVLKNVLDISSFKAKEKGLYVYLDVDPEVPMFLVSDPTRLQQILLNLINNAIKFTDRGGVDLLIRLHARHGDKVEIEFNVKDSGIGMTTEQIDILFKPFSQADNSTTRKYGGTGLGLSISKQLVEMMHGSIGIESLQGVGTTLRFSILTQVCRDEEVIASLADDPHGLDMEYDFHQMSVLLVEDNLINQQVAKELLDNAGIKTAVANNGMEAVEAVAAQNFDLILMDIQMPEMDGYQATQEIRKHHSQQSLPILAMSANVMQSDRDKAEAAGMNDHIGKPIDILNLYNKLARWGMRSKPSQPDMNSKGAAALLNLDSYNKCNVLSGAQPATSAGPEKCAITS